MSIDLYADENEPVADLSATVYRVKFPRPTEVRSSDTYWLYVEVDQYECISLQDHSYFQGKQIRKMDWKEREEVYNFLIEWELAEWRKVGPEDHELFATKKLMGENDES